MLVSLAPRAFLSYFVAILFLVSENAGSSGYYPNLQCQSGQVNYRFIMLQHICYVNKHFNLCLHKINQLSGVRKTHHLKEH